MEKHGIAVATICTDEFFALGKAEAECLGMPGLPIAVIPHPVAKQPPETIAAYARDTLDEVLHIWESDADSLRAEYRDKTVVTGKRLRYHSMFEGDFNAPDAPARFKAPDDDVAAMRLLYRRGWTDGLPIVLPTPERCERMIAESGHDSDALLGLIEPRQGQATLARVAVNAVMAGCEPAHLPVVAAAVRAMATPEFNLKALNTTTHPCTVLVLVNGPVADALDINAGANAMGQGCLANAVIGRALRFVLTNIGGGAPGVLDRATAGSPAKYSFCFAENEADSPWEPLHVERGFDAATSTVTVCGVEGPHNVNDHYSQTAEEILLTVAGVMATPGVNHSYLRGEILVALGPEHADIIARSGFSKDDVKRFLIEHAIIPPRHIGAAQMALYRQRVPERLIEDGQGVPGAGGVRIATAPEHIMVVVAGGAGRHSQVIPSFGGTTRSVTLPIDTEDRT